MLRAIVSEFFPRVSTVWLGGVDLGEQMLSPEFDNVLRSAREHESLDVEMVTSGVMITRDRAALMASTMSRVYLSLEGTGSHYTHIRGVSWRSFLTRVEWLTACGEIGPASRRLGVSLLVTVMRERQEDCLQLVGMAKQLGIRSIDFHHFIPLLPAHVSSSLLYYPAESNQFFRELAGHALVARVPIATPVECPVRASDAALRRRPCYLPFETMGIHANGRVTSCCNAQFHLGWYEPGLDAIHRNWNRHRYRALRASVNSTTPPAACVRCAAVNDDPRAYRPRFGLVDRVRLGVKRVLPPALTAIVTRT